MLETEQGTRKTKSLSSWNLHAGELSVEVTVLQLNYQLRLCPKCLKNTKAVTETLPASQEFQERPSRTYTKDLDRLRIGFKGRVSARVSRLMFTDSEG